MSPMQRLLATSSGMLVAWSGFGSPLAAQAAANGFAVKRQVVVHAMPARVYAALTEVSRWWSPAHTFSSDARNLSMDAKPGGCFCEKLPGGGGVEHMRVIYASPRKALRLSGGLGPLQAGGLAATMTWTLTQAGDSTRVDMSYVVGGYMEGGLERLPPMVDGVLGEQMARLKLFVETGKPTKG